MKENKKLLENINNNRSRSINTDLSIKDTVRENMTLMEGIAEAERSAKEFGLDPNPVHFELVPAEIMYETAAYGVPGRFQHWSFGREFYKMKTQYDMGMSKIYEMVTNTLPAMALLMENNTDLENIFVAAHVFGHSDFFKNNTAFRNTDRSIKDNVVLHAERIHEYEKIHGIEEVEKILDAAFSLEFNLDPTSRRIWNAEEYMEENESRFRKKKMIKKSRSGPYDDLFTPPELNKEKNENLNNIPVPFPSEEEQDILGLISTFSRKPLKPWQQDILEIIRSETYYFYPLMQTKTMNEGWASLWHSRIMREIGDGGLLKDNEYLDFIQLHSGVVVPVRNQLNPYFTGLKIWEDIDNKYPRGHHLHHSKGIFAVREETPTDQAFFRNKLTNDLIKEMDMYVYAKKGDEWVITEKDPEVVRDTLASSYTNMGLPVIKIAVGGGDYDRTGELKLIHHDEGKELDQKWAEKVLINIEFLWGKPVHLQTIEKGKTLFLTSRNGAIERKTEFPTA